MMKKVLLLLSVALIFVACADDDSFSTSKSNRLSFMKDGVEIDTLTLDTVFAHIGSSTYTFWVHNQSSDGIRLTNVMLRGGNQYGFRVNVDGTYLGKDNGYQMNDLEIRKGDSVRVFVEVLSPSQKGIPARTLDDAIVFNLESGISQSLALH
ncbi:MAG: right-handed parallel beta-helix repeat-containing protein, partial [Prevotella sp.]|nr:right-handed parallel beta-helix repeat-containing protein [Prevotella sp.]